MNIATQSLLLHNKDTLKFANLLKGDFRANFFNIVNLNNFTEGIEKIRTSLENNGYLPTLNPYDLLDISELSHSENGTHILIHVKSPILSGKPFTLYEYIPLPIRADNSLCILNSAPKFYFNNEKNATKAISIKFVENCKHIDTHIMCNSIVSEMTHDPDKCMRNIIKNGQESGYSYKKMIFQNYFIRLETHSIYCVIVTLIKLRITCDQKEEIHDLLTSREINFSDHCAMHKVTNELKYDLDTFSTSEINTLQKKPNFAIYDKSNDKWSDEVPLTNKYDIKIQTLLNETNHSEETIQLSKNTGYNIKRSNDHGILMRIWSVINSLGTIELWAKILIAIICTLFIVIIAILYVTPKQF